MNLPRPNRSTLLLSLCLAALVGALGFEHYQLTQLRSSLAATADKSSIDAILQRLSKIDDRLDSVDGKHLVTDDDFRAGQQALSNRIDAVQAYAKQATETAQDLSRTAASASELLVLKANIETLDSSLQELRKTQVQPPPLVIPKPKTAGRRSATAQKPKPKPVAPEPPPFNVLGIEYRGGERFLSIAPPGSTQLSQIYLVRPGDALTGTAWRLSSLDDRSARFDVAGTPRTITVAP